MRKTPVLTPQEAALLVRDGDTLASGGFVSSACPEALSSALERRFLETGHPRDLTLFFGAGHGNRNGTGGDHYGHAGMVRRVVCGHWDRTPRLGALALEGKIEAYNLPQGVITHMYRDIAAHNPATLSKVGLHTFVDPRLEGGKLNGRTKEDLVKLVEVEGQEFLLYRCFPVNAVFLRASWADEYGNCTAHREIGPTDLTAMAQACRNSGGKVIVQVEKIVAGGTLDPKLVVIPGIYVDAIVVGSEAEHQQCMDAAYDGSLTGEFRAPADALAPLPLDARKVIARRAAMELRPGAVVNLGVGIPERVARVAAEEGISQEMTLTVEAGSVGGVPRGGTQFGGAANPAAILPQNVQFDFYHGGGLDIACLGMAEIAPGGDVNVSRFHGRLAGSGGFIDISQNAGEVVFCGTFTAHGLDYTISLVESDKNCWESNEANFFYSSMHDDGYAVRLYTDNDKYSGGAENMLGKIDNVCEYTAVYTSKKIPTYFALARLSAYKFLPLSLKNVFYVTDSYLVNQYTTSDSATANIDLS